MITWICKSHKQALLLVNLTGHVSFRGKWELASLMQRMSGSEVLMWSRRDVGGHEVAARVDKPRKEEAAGVLDQAWGKSEDGRGDGCIRGAADGAPGA